MFRKILIANRGAIAVRIIRTLKAMGIASVAVYAEADARSRHVTLADEAWSLGEGGASDTYLDQDKLFAVMEKSGAGAVHPGYGFLSENAGFARRCEAAGVVFLGPTPEQMEAFGLKHTARALAEQAGVPLLPGSGLLDTVDAAVAAAGDIGYPVMLKSTAGGGGIGMKLCYDADELRAHYHSVRRLGESNFADSGVFLEKFVERARHIEVQVFGDGAGRAVALGERDCSSQRRNQKVIEETPAVDLPGTLRKHLHGSAVALMETVRYRSAGTVEFIYDPKAGEAYFLEVNTRLQVEHGVTEQVYGVDLVSWMVRLGAGAVDSLDPLAARVPSGHALQVRVYAEDPARDFQPSAGLLTSVDFPAGDGDRLRIDHWLEPGIEVSPFFDPMLAKLIVHRETRDEAIAAMVATLDETRLYGIETNLAYVRAVLDTPVFRNGDMYTRFLDGFRFRAPTLEVLSAGTMTTIQDAPGRVGYWSVGVPPSGPFDSLSFRLGNALLGNDDDAAGLEMTLNGGTFRFHSDTQMVLAGAVMEAELETADNRVGTVEPWRIVDIPAGAVLRLGKVQGHGARTYLLVRGGLQCPHYLGARATFTLGQFGGHCGRALRKGDVLHLDPDTVPAAPAHLPEELEPGLTDEWQIAVTYGPHGAPDFFTENDIETLFDAHWEVHYNSSRTGVRLIGPKPEWARSDGGEAGLHPSNIHDNAYALGTVDFTGDMPVILGPDGPSLGGFVCPLTVVRAERWKLGQLKAGDRIRFVPVTVDQAVALADAEDEAISRLQLPDSPLSWGSAPAVASLSPVAARFRGREADVDVTCRIAGDDYLLVEYGENSLDIALRFRVHALMLRLRDKALPGIVEMTPGVRSLQLHYDSARLRLGALLSLVRETEDELSGIEALEVPSRIVHLPLSWNDEACQLAVEKYMQSVRRDAPWCPDNLEFIRRINGLDSIDQVKRIVFDASYVVMGLGDVYLGAPLATPLDPRHRLVTTKYNPARTWTAENSVGIGGSYLCVYGMEGPGGYQFVGRTLQMWNRYKRTREFSEPWLLRFFDQIRFYEVSGEELARIRRQFPHGDYPLEIEETRFSLGEYQRFLKTNAADIATFTDHRRRAFDGELQRWIADGQFNFSSETPIHEGGHEERLPDHAVAVESEAAGSVWRVLVEPGQRVARGQPVVILESMKMEIEVASPDDGIVESVLCPPGQQVHSGQRLLVLNTEETV
jgi:urea carboxylase